ncbi:GRAK protein, partial [Loxia curvirostra]|nr:GRAK protein [Loxia curvirostra]
YVAFLQGKDNQTCGGFLVAPAWVMTAAQCLQHKPLTVILGAQSLQRREESWQTFQVKEYHCYPGFTSPKKGRDILLLKLNGTASSNGHVRPISFLEKSKIWGGTQCSLVGWGDRTATVTIISQRDCLNQDPGLADNLICGQSKSSKLPEKVSVLREGEEGSFELGQSTEKRILGDAGDPLVCNNKAFGIFSYRHNNWPGFYTHIAPYLPWVHSVMK